MKRIAYESLLHWKNSSARKPLLIDGARQVGKSYLIREQFGPNEFARVHTLDFRKDRSLKSLFEDTLQPKTILRNIEVHTGQKIDITNDLIFFDEIGECQEAIDSLKYFCEDMPELYLCSSGSNIGLLNSFPVGKTYDLSLYPMNFYEFLLASNDEILIEEFEKQSRLKTVHEKLWSHLLNYYFVGGMPEAVEAWHSNEEILEKISSVQKVHEDLLSGYFRDFGKYNGKINALHIESVFKSVPTKLSETVDDSVKRYTFKNVIEGKRQYSQLRGPIDWLEKSKLISKNYIVRSQPTTPLSTLVDENFFKLFFFDVGLLTHALDITYQESQKQNYAYKGFIAENFVQNELRTIGHSPTFSWAEARSEIEFIHKTRDGALVPLEVKSGKRTKARSLETYIKKYNPNFTIKLIGGAGGTSTDHLVWPLYYTQFLP